MQRNLHQRSYVDEKSKQKKRILWIGQDPRNIEFSRQQKNIQNHDNYKNDKSIDFYFNDSQIDYQILQQFNYFKKLHNKLDKYLNPKDMNTIIKNFNDLEINVISLKKKMIQLQDIYQQKIGELIQEKENDQHQILSQENTIKELHRENDKLILIIESLQHENVQLCEQDIVSSLCVKTNQNYHVTNTSYCQRNYEALNNKVHDLLSENQLLKKDNHELNIFLYKLKLEFQSEKQKNSQLLIHNSKLIEQKYLKKIKMLKLQNQALSTENESLTELFKHQYVHKSMVKKLKRNNFSSSFKIKTPIKQIEEANEKSTEKSIEKYIHNEKIDIGIFTDDPKMDENNINYEENFNIEKERRKALASLLARFVRMLNIKCNQLMEDCNTLLDSQNSRLDNIQNVLQVL